MNSIALKLEPQINITFCSIATSRMCHKNSDIPAAADIPHPRPKTTNTPPTLSTPNSAAAPSSPDSFA